MNRTAPSRLPGLDVSVDFLLLLHLFHAAFSAPLLYYVYFNAKQTLMEAGCSLTVGEIKGEINKTYGHREGAVLSAATTLL